MGPTPKELIWFIGRSSKRIAVTVVGAAVVAAGLAMLVLPGPGILVIALGFAILGTEYAWAAAAFEKTKRHAERAGRAAKGKVSGRIRRRPLVGTPRAGEQPGGEQPGAGPPAAGPPGGGSPAPPP
jgi:putative transmembrane protein PGPGW